MVCVCSAGAAQVGTVIPAFPDRFWAETGPFPGLNFARFKAVSGTIIVLNRCSCSAYWRSGSATRRQSLGSESEFGMQNHEFCTQNHEFGTQNHAF